jgi:hypothetical protein
MSCCKSQRAILWRAYALIPAVSFQTVLLHCLPAQVCSLNSILTLHQSVRARRAHEGLWSSARGHAGLLASASIKSCAQAAVFDAWLGLAADVVPTRSCDLRQGEAGATANSDLEGCTLKQWNEQCSPAFGGHVRKLQQREAIVVNDADFTTYDSDACPAAALEEVLGAFTEDVTPPFEFAVRAMLVAHTQCWAAAPVTTCITT